MNHRYRHAKLLACLLLVIVVPPFLSKSDTWLFEGFLFVTLAAGAYSAGTNKGRAWLLALIGGISIAARVGSENLHNAEALVPTFLVGYILFFSIVAVTLVKSLFESKARVNADTLYGAISVYLLLGLIWAFVFILHETLSPGSYLLDGERLSRPGFTRLIGFSFVTLSTVGYGNFVPSNPQADALATLEAIVGQVYLAIVIARLVALEIAGAQGQRGAE